MRRRVNLRPLGYEPCKRVETGWIDSICGCSEAGRIEPWGRPAKQVNTPCCQGAHVRVQYSFRGLRRLTSP